jgi:peptidoglycan-N-acetylglucosamine deacetylase
MGAMPGAGRGDGERWESPPLTSEKLVTRRAEWRRQRARRRAVAGALVLAVLVGAIVASTSGGSSVPKSHPNAVTSGVSLSRGYKSAIPAHSAALGVPSWLAARYVNNVLGYTSYVRVGSGRKREVALTFDDGPSTYTPRILRVLARWHVPATFFVIGKMANAYPQYVRAEAQAGNEVGDHTQTHAPMSALSAADQRAQIVDAGNAIRSAGAPFPTLWRPPYGVFNSTTISILQSLRMLMVLWTVDTSDYARPGVSRIAYTAESGARPGAIILMHDGGGDRAETVAALPRIIASLRRRGYQIVTVPQLLADDPPSRSQPGAVPAGSGESGGPAVHSTRPR